MRKNLLLSLVVVSAPAWSQPAPAAPIAVPRELTDPAAVAKIGNAAQALSNAMLDLRIGEVKAAVEGRQATMAEKRMTVRDLGRRDDPNFDRNIQQGIAQAGPTIQRSLGALTAAIPSLMQGLEQISRAVERAAANMPDPNYPRR